MNIPGGASDFTVGIHTKNCIVCELESPSLSLSFFLSFDFSLSVLLPLSLPLSLSFPLSLSLSLSLLSLCPSLSFFLSRSPALSPYLSLSPFLSVLLSLSPSRSVLSPFLSLFLYRPHSLLFISVLCPSPILSRCLSL